jgi:hypothetical protein
MATELYINNKLCDLEKKEIIAMSLGVNRLTDIESRQGYFSNTFKLPKTAQNLDVFGIPTELNSGDTTRWERLECAIITDGVYQVFGFAQLQSVKDEISVVVKGGNAEFVDDIRDLELNDINIAQLDHVRDLATVNANRFNDYTSGFVYPDVDYNLLLNITNPIPFWFMFPAVFIDPILRAIVLDAGYTISGDILNDALFRKMQIPFSREYLRVDEAFVEANQFRAKMIGGANLTVTTFPAPGTGLYVSNYAAGFDNDSTDGYFDNPNAFTLGSWGGGLSGNPNAWYIPPIAITQTIHFTVTFTVSNWDATDSNLRIRIFGLTTANTQTSSFYVHQDEVNANGTFTIQLYATETGIPTNNIHIKFELIVDDGSFFEVAVLSGVMYNEVSERYDGISDLDMAANLPEMKQTDFIKYLVNAFSLLINTNTSTKEVSFTFFDSVPTNTGEDWSDKEDFSETEEITPNYGKYKRNNYFEYDNNKADDAIKELPKYGRHAVVNTNIPSGDKIVYKSPFSASRPLAAFPDRMFIHLSDAKDSAEFEIVSYTSPSSVGTVVISNTDGFSEGDSVFFKELDAAVVIDGTLSLEGLQGVTIKEIISTTTFTISGSSFGSAYAGFVGYQKDAYKTKDPKPRIAVHNVVDVDNDTALIQLIGGTAVTQASQLTFTDLEFSNLIANYGVVLSTIIISPQMVSMLMRLSAVDINQIDFTKPKWIDRFNCFFYLSYINQYKVNEVDSTEVELIKLP